MPGISKTVLSVKLAQQMPNKFEYAIWRSHSAITRATVREEVFLERSMVTQRVRWTSTDLDLLPENEGTRYEIVDGELFVTRAPHWKHQRTCFKICRELETWSESSGLGQASISAGVLFSESDNVIPDVVWASHERLAALLDEAGHLTGAPELVVEVLSAGTENVRRDREAKLKLYASRGVQEYWIADWRLQQLEVYRRENATLQLISTLLSNDQISSPLLPGFTSSVSQLFM